MPAHARRLARALSLGLLALLLVVSVAAVTGRPVVSYAKSGSMEPAIGTFDAFLIEPWPRDLSEGDIIVFDSLSRGERSVHRIVGGSASGWYTQGDANPSADQAAQEPLVTPDRIRGRVVTWPDGSPVLLPSAGLPLVRAQLEWAKLENAAGGPTQLRLGILASAGAALVLASVAGGRGAPEAPSVPSRATRSFLRRLFPRGVLGRHVAAGLVLLLAASGTWAAAHADTPVVIQMVVVRDGSAADTLRAAAPGATLERTFEVGALGLLPTLALLEPEGGRLAPRQDTLVIAPMQREATLVAQTADAEPGSQEDTLHVWRYPRVLPDAATTALHDALPGSPYLALAGIGAALAVLSVRAMGILQLPVGPWLGLREEWR